MRLALYSRVCSLSALLGVLPSGCGDPSMDELTGQAAALTATPPANPCTDPDATGVKVVPPPSGAYHGFFIGLGDGVAITDAVISSYETLAGKRVAWVYFENDWGRDGVLNIQFPTANVQTIWNHGAVPFIRFAPWTTGIEDRQDPVVRLKDVVDTTKFDAALVSWLLAAKATKIPLIVQFGVEVNGSWFPWNGYWNGKGTKTWHDPTWPDGPEAYRLAYQKIIDLARKNNVWNITWALHFSHWPQPAEGSAAWNQMKYYYPGDSYIDWVGLSVYGEMFPYHDPKQWNPLVDLAGTNNPQIVGGRSPYSELAAVTTSKTKPMALFETGVVEDPAAGDKAAWIKATYAAVTGGTFPRLHGVNWWNESWDNGAPLGVSDMRINSSSATLAGYNAAVSSSQIVATPSFSCTKNALP